MELNKKKIKFVLSNAKGKSEEYFKDFKIDDIKAEEQLIQKIPKQLQLR